MKLTNKRIRNSFKSLWSGILLMVLAISSIGCSQFPWGAKPASTTPSNSAALETVQQVTQPTAVAQVQLKKLRIHYLDVGQADSMLIQTPDERNILIDAAESENAEQIIAYIKKLGINRLDIVAATHPHEDHIGGMAKVIQAFEVTQVLMPKATTTTRTFENLLLAIRSKGLKITEAKAGITLEPPTEIPAEQRVTFEILSPSAGNYDDLNNSSAVMRLVYGKTTFLFTGDAETMIEKTMLKESRVLQANVLKVGHHGSSSSTSAEFLKAVNPAYAIISVAAENKYAHPSPSTITRLKKAGVAIYRTDESGTILVESDGEQVTVTPSKS